MQNYGVASATVYKYYERSKKSKILHFDIYILN
jgi:hypothetical protein